jgi:hypothetical protein
MFLRAKTRGKDGKKHRYWSVLETGRARLRPSRAATRTVSRRDQLLTRTRLAQVDFGDRGRGAGGAAQHALFPEDRCEGLPPDESIVRLTYQGDATAPPAATATCWLALTPWQTLDLDVFRAERPPLARKGNPLGIWWCSCDTGSVARGESGSERLARGSYPRGCRSNADVNAYGPLPNRHRIDHGVTRCSDGGSAAGTNNTHNSGI